jgi:hypothetical protein
VHRGRRPWPAAPRLPPAAVRNLERAGVSRSVGMSVTGHKTEAVFRRYAIVDSAVQTEAAALLDAHEGQVGKELGKVAPRRVARLG